MRTRARARRPVRRTALYRTFRAGMVATVGPAGVPFEVRTTLPAGLVLQRLFVPAEVWAHYQIASVYLGAEVFSAEAGRPSLMRVVRRPAALVVAAIKRTRDSVPFVVCAEGLLETSGGTG